MDATKATVTLIESHGDTKYSIAGWIWKLEWKLNPTNIDFEKKYFDLLIATSSVECDFEMFL